MGKGEDIRKQLSESLDLPKDVIMNTPKITVTGDNEISIDNHKGILEYTAEILRLNSAIGIIKICGSNINISQISQENIEIKGEIVSIEYIK